MSKKILLLILGLLSAQASNAVLVTLPNQETLKQRLRSKGFDHFVEKTNIVQVLADEEKEVLGVIMAVKLSLYDYANYVNNPIISAAMQLNEPHLLELFLEGNDEAISESKELLKEIEEK